MADDRTPPQQDLQATISDDLEQEFYTALRAAGASAEEAQSCLRAAAPPAAGDTLLH